MTSNNIRQQEWRKCETLLTAILDNVLDGIITINEQGNIESFNKSAEQIFGYAAAEVVGHNVKVLMPEPFHSQHGNHFQNYLSTGNSKSVGMSRELIGQHKDGSTFPVNLVVSEMELDQKRMFIGIVRDLSEHVKIERMKTEFVSTVSHELRTPLTSIRGSLALLAGGAGGELPVQAKSLIDIALKNSERLILLINDILDMDRIEAGRMEFHLSPIRLMPLLKQALESNQAYAEQYKVSYELEGDFPEVMVNVDSKRLLQIMANLLSNAAKFSPEGAKVILSITSNGQHARIEVINHGSGIPEQFHDQIFQKFSQADSSDTRQKGGTGLGLSITKAMVEKMHGSIGFKSEPDVLTAFFVDFPIWHEAAAAVSGVVPTVAAIETADRERILVCGDNPVSDAFHVVDWITKSTHRDQLITALRQAIGRFSATRPKVLHIEDDQGVALVVNAIVGEIADVENAPTLADARCMLQRNHYDLAILDILLPDGSGMELLPLLNGAIPPIPVMVFSSHEMEQSDIQKVQSVLVKSRTDNVQLLATIKRLTGSE